MLLEKNHGMAYSPSMNHSFLGRGLFAGQCSTSTSSEHRNSLEVRCHLRCLVDLAILLCFYLSLVQIEFLNNRFSKMGGNCDQPKKISLHKLFWKYMYLMQILFNGLHDFCVLCVLAI